jgi:hypothetical protein
MAVRSEKKLNIINNFLVSDQSSASASVTLALEIRAEFGLKRKKYLIRKTRLILLRKEIPYFTISALCPCDECLPMIKLLFAVPFLLACPRSTDISASDIRESLLESDPHLALMVTGQK